MGTVWFFWQDPRYQLMLLQAREDRVIKPAAWWDEDEETKDILGGRDEKTGGTWLACSKQGRVAFLVNVTRRTSLTHAGAELLTVKFLKSKMTTSEFAKELVSNKNMSSGLTFNLVVADIPSKSMVYISKKFPTKDVDEIDALGPGLYFITSAGLYDLASPQNKRLKDQFNEALSKYENRELPMRELAHKLMNTDQIILPEGEGETDTSRTGQKGYYNGTITLEVNPTGKVSFNEHYMENDEFKEHEFDFNIE